MKNITPVFIVIMMLAIVSTASVFPQKRTKLNNTQGVPCPGTPTVTYLGKIYNTVQIGNQCWLKENLDVGTRIDGSQPPTDSSIIEKYCYDNDTNNCNTYGGLYKWIEAIQYSTIEGARGICPSGWHIPTATEFQTLSATVGGDGNVLKAVGQGSGAGAGTNTSGFSALLGGNRNYNGLFNSLGYYASFWSSTSNLTYYAYVMGLNYNASDIYYYDDSYFYKAYSFSVRCVMDIADGVDDKDKAELPKEFLLVQNYPNPFNPGTKISFSVPKESFITLKIYDLLGREVATLVQDKKQRGEYSITWNAEGMPGGVYFYRLVGGDYIQTKKMVLMK